MEIDFDQVDAAQKLSEQRKKQFGEKPMTAESVQRAIERFKKTGTFASPVIEIEVEIVKSPLLLE